jgi:hypothetical protein
MRKGSVQKIAAGVQKSTQVVVKMIVMLAYQILTMPQEMH